MFLKLTVMTLNMKVLQIQSVINYNINKCDFSRISLVETESDLEKPEFAKLTKKSWEVRKQVIMKSILVKYKSSKYFAFVSPQVNLELKTTE